MVAISKKTILAGVTVTNRMHLGNYIGALKNWVQIQSEYECFFFAADLHAITIKQDPKILQEQTLVNIATYVAAGVDANSATLFLQSEVPQHSQLAWVLNCFAYMGELSRMTQFKDKSERAGSNIPVGIFTYPLLMAADILLYDAHFVPVGSDQKQHIELTRDLAQRMNAIYGQDTFVVPQPYIGKIGAKIMDLLEPNKKMSKSSLNENGTIFLTDSPKEIEKKLKRAVTDSGSEIIYSDEKPGVKNLIEIQASILKKTPSEIQESYIGKQYGHLKGETAAIIIEELKPFQQRLKELLSDRGELLRILDQGRVKAVGKASTTVKRVYDRIGLGRND